MSNYIMPPRRYASDYAKGKMTQDEIIALQIANDANISKARKALKFGEIQPLSAIEAKTPEEMIADMGVQEASARSNLERLGFRPQEAATIISTIRSDPTLDFVSLNANFPAIEADIKKRFNVKLLTPTFFIEYFRKYSNELEGITGMKVFDTGVNGFINTISELRQILPSRQQFNNLLRRTNDSATKDILQRLEKSLPSEADYNRIDQLNPVERQNIIQNLTDATENLPSRDQVDNAIASGRVAGIADSIPDGIDGRLNDILSQVRDIAETTTLIEARLDKRDEKEQSGRKLKWKIGDPEIDDYDTFTRLYKDNKQKYLVDRSRRGDFFYNFDAEGKPTNEKLNYNQLDNISSGSADIVFKNFLNARKPSAVSTPVKETASTISGVSNRTPIGVEDVFKSSGETQIKKGDGLKKLKMKVGRGLAVKETPSYREYGKYAIHIPQLEQQDILNVKYKSLGQVPKFKPIPVSDIFRDFILDLLENGKPNSRVYSQIPNEERKFFEEMSIGAGVWNGLGLKRTTTSTDEEENKRFEILRGEYLAGNNNPKLLSELRRLVVKMMNDGRIRKRQGLDLLMELSA